jgi:cell division protein FtsQ
MLGYHKRKREKAIESWISKRKTAFNISLLKNKRRIISLCVLIMLCMVAFKYVIPDINSEQYISLKKITPKSLKRISPEAFRKIIGYDYKEEIYAKDTSEIRARLEASSMILGNVNFLVKLFPYYELEINFIEASPLFTLMPQRSDSVPIIYSDNGKIYPYSVNAVDLPVVDAKEPYDIALATKFLIDMRKNDALLYSRISQLIPSVSERQITVFFNDVDFKTKFSLESDYWRTAFRYYRQLTRNMQVLNINYIAILDLRFKQLAYTIEKKERL